MVTDIPSRIGQMSGEEMSELQHSEKFVKEVHAAEVRQPRVITGEFDVSR
jgi:hypothetical protein